MAKQRMMKVLLPICLLLFVCMYFMSMTMNVTNKNKDNSYDIVNLPSNNQPKDIAVANNRSASITIDARSGEMLSGENENLRLPMASTTKIVTALIAIENNDLEEYVTIDKKAVGIEGSSIYLKENQRWKLKDLLYGLMLRSGNDSAEMIAIHVGGGSRDKFVEMMNKKATDLGLRNTSFTNPSGLHHEMHYTSASDLAKLTAEAYKHRKFAEIVSEKMHTTDVVFDADGKETKFDFYNKNKMLALVDGANGVKTGYTKNSGRCLVSAVKRNNLQLICVVLNIGDMWNYSEYLLENAVKKYEKVTLAKAGEPIAYARISETISGYYPVCAKEDISIYLRKSDSEKISYRFLQNKSSWLAPIEKDRIMGHLEIYMGKQLIFLVKAYNMENIQNIYGEVKQKPIFPIVPQLPE